MIQDNPWPIEVLVEIFKWFSIEERLQQLASACKLFLQAVHTPKVWKMVDTNLEFTLHIILFLGTLNISQVSVIVILNVNKGADI